MEEIRIRRMTDADMPAIHIIDKRLVGPERSSSWLESVESVWFTHRPALNFVAEKSGLIVGFILGDIRGAEYGLPFGGWIDMIGILPEFQRKGIAKKLVEEFCARCQENEVKVRVIIREDDALLVNFWKSLDFRKGNLISFEK